MSTPSADPQVAAVPAAGGASIPQLPNPGAARFVFKVKSSKNSKCRLQPVFGFVEPGARIEITGLTGAPKEDKLVIQFEEAPADAVDASAAFNVTRLPLHGSAADAGDEVTLPFSDQ